MYSRCGQLAQQQKANKWGVTIPPVCLVCSQWGTEWLCRTSVSSSEIFVKGHGSQISLQEALSLVIIFSTCSISRLWQFRSSSKTPIMLLKVPKNEKKKSPKNSTLHCSLQKSQGRTVINQGKSLPLLHCSNILCYIPYLWTTSVTCLSAMNVSKIALPCFVFAQHFSLMFQFIINENDW